MSFLCSGLYIGRYTGNHIDQNGLETLQRICRKIGIADLNPSE